MKKKNQKLEIVTMEYNLPVFMYILTMDEFQKYHDKIMQEKMIDHWHKELEINYILDGQVDYYIDGKHYEAKKGDIIIINCESIHSVVPNIDEVIENRIVFTLLIKYEFIKNLIPDLDESIFIIEKIKDLNSIKICIEEIFKYYKYYKNQYENIAISGLLHKLIYELCISGAKRNKSSILLKNKINIQKVKEILEYITNNYKEPLKQEDIAKYFYFSREYFSRFFKKYTGITFKEYLTVYRLQKAVQKMMECDSSMANIAQDTGFSDTRQFIKCFKKYYKATPYQYKIKQVTKE
ncbi:AraC family transcriptional regulator [Clostridium sp. SHJSY1]|uniref:AraC family transcriptional regulator n=1 Tax=Clostridium sp. SHJSY1 TaxID=2942483 RepID=UPI002876DA06|nr:AraC family transcriptional regulator [Clostridium sp. SHJSY1]MDS0524292.1 AraC family transcriptional regulator [Clostridium sp. SHJSY1]